MKFADLYDFQKKCEVKYKADKAKYEYKPFLISVLVSKKVFDRSSGLAETDGGL